MGVGTDEGETVYYAVTKTETEEGSATYTVGDKLTLTVCRVSANYEIQQEQVEITLVEDRGDTVYSSGSSQSGQDSGNGFGGFDWPF